MNFAGKFIISLIFLIAVTGCTSKCGNGICETTFEGTLNCPADCKVSGNAAANASTETDNYILPVPDADETPNNSTDGIPDINTDETSDGERQPEQESPASSPDTSNQNCVSDGVCRSSCTGQDPDCVNECSGDAQCNDSNTCTDDSCSGGNCIYENNSLSCGIHDCDYLDTACRDYSDANKSCSGGKCISEPCSNFTDAQTGASCGTGKQCDGSGNCEIIPEKCVSNNDCDDKNPCTTDSCGSSGQCSYSKKSTGTSCGTDKECNLDAVCVSIQAPCVAESSCDDGDSCTANDMCGSDGTCSGSQILCGTNSSCSGGACTCNSGYVDCDSNAANGCEAATSASCPVCITGTTESCTIGGCSGARTCNLSGQWGLCSKADACCGISCGTISCPSGASGSCSKTCSAGVCQSCTLNCTETSCSDGIDNDNDGLKDSADPNCNSCVGQADKSQPQGCNGNSMCCGSSCAALPTNCGECKTTQYICSQTNEVCGNASSSTSCTDDGNPCTYDLCNGSGSCSHANKAAGTSCGTGKACNSGGQCLPTTETSCIDNIDNDGDGLIDCRDPDCTAISCGTCTYAACNASTHQWYCANSTSSTTCGAQDCDYLDTSCRNYTDVTKYCSGGGVCGSASCSVYTNVSSGTSCGTKTCPQSYCVGSTPYTYQASCSKTCNGSGSCNDCTCTATQGTACSGNTYCSSGSCVTCSSSQVSDPAMRIRCTAAAAGASVTLPIDFTGAEGKGVTDLQVNIKFDPSKLTLTNISEGAAAASSGKSVTYNEYIPGTYVILVTSTGSTAIGSGTVISLSFNVPSASSGNVQISMDALYASNVSGNPVSVNKGSGTISVQ